MKVTHVVALSGGKDSTAMALLLSEREPREYVFLCTPTGDELPPMREHYRNLEALLGPSSAVRPDGTRGITYVTRDTLFASIERNRALPNFRMRFCTRELKIRPCLDWMRSHAPCVLYVGLRADEPERRGLYSEECEVRFPLREWGLGIDEVRRVLKERGVRVPTRTDCARCPFQRLSEWKALMERYPEVYEDAVQMEARFDATFRSPGRDTKPTALADLRTYFEQQTSLVFEDLDEDYDDYEAACTVCRK